jgi:hypothetical protein
MDWPLPTKARKDPLGYQYLNNLQAEQEGTQRLALVQHNADGGHNALEVARAVGSFSYSAGAYSIDAGSSSIITAVSKFGVGIVDITLAANYLAIPIGMRVAVIDTTGESVPCIAGHFITSATSVRVYLKALSSLLGNTWNLTDLAFAVALHALPYTSNATPISTLDQFWMREMTVGYADWNAIISNQAQMQTALLLEHKTDGTHNTRNIAKSAGRVTWDGAAYTLADDERVTSAAGVSTGRARVTLDAGHTLALQVFPTVDYNTAAGNQSDLMLINAPKTQFVAGPPTTFDVFMYKYDASVNQWARAHSDFAFSVHTAPS